MPLKKGTTEVDKEANHKGCRQSEESGYKFSPKRQKNAGEGICL